MLILIAQYKINKVQSETNSNRGLIAQKKPIGLNISQFLFFKIELLITAFSRLATRTAVRKMRTLAPVYAAGQIVFCASITNNWCIGVRWRILVLL